MVVWYCEASQRHASAETLAGARVTAPCGQGWHWARLTAPGEGLKVCRGHGVQGLLAWLALKKPGAHSEQTWQTCATHSRPLSHGWQLCKSSLRVYTRYPAGQLSSLYLPSGPTPHSDPFTLGYTSLSPFGHAKPAGHGVHACTWGSMMYSAHGKHRRHHCESRETFISWWPAGHSSSENASWLEFRCHRPMIRSDPSHSIPFLASAHVPSTHLAPSGQDDAGHARHCASVVAPTAGPYVLLGHLLQACGPPEPLKHTLRPRPARQTLLPLHAAVAHAVPCRAAAQPNHTLLHFPRRVGDQRLHSAVSEASQSEWTRCASARVGVENVFCARVARPALLCVVAECSRGSAVSGVDQLVAFGAAYQDLQTFVVAAPSANGERILIVGVSWTRSTSGTTETDAVHKVLSSRALVASPDCRLRGGHGPPWALSEKGGSWASWDRSLVRQLRFNPPQNRRHIQYHHVGGSWIETIRRCPPHARVGLLISGHHRGTGQKR
eukprot:2955131-Rhodomonas_salina.2